MEVYSDAFVHEETGDLLGYELAIRPKGDGVDALLYVYEGGESDGIPLSGKLSGQALVIEGNWVEHLIEYPSKKEIVQTHFVVIKGTITPARFQGALKIAGLTDHRSIRLKRVDHIWICRQQ